MLVITIIVMIILAAAIILSLQGSEIIGKANQAKTESDVATFEEEVKILYANWQLSYQLGDTEDEAIDYIKENLSGKYKEEWIEKITISEDGTLVIGNLNSNEVNYITNKLNGGAFPYTSGTWNTKYEYILPTDVTLVSLTIFGSDFYPDEFGYIFFTDALDGVGTGVAPIAAKFDASRGILDFACYDPWNGSVEIQFNWSDRYL